MTGHSGTVSTALTPVDVTGGVASVQGMQTEGRQGTCSLTLAHCSAQRCYQNSVECNLPIDPLPCTIGQRRLAAGYGFGRMCCVLNQEFVLKSRASASIEQDGVSVVSTGSPVNKLYQ